MDDINEKYTAFYLKRKPVHLYPTEFVTRIFLATYPNLNLRDHLPKGSRVLEIGFGDGRNTVLLCQSGFEVYGTEITQGIVDQASQTLAKLHCHARLSVGRNSKLPFEDAFFDCLLAVHSCYYIDQGQRFEDNLKSFCRVLRKDGYFVASLPMLSSFIFEGSEAHENGSRIITRDPYGNRIGYTLQAFESEDAVRNAFSPYFHDMTIGSARNEFFGIGEHVYWIVCKRT